MPYLLLALQLVAFPSSFEEPVTITAEQGQFFDWQAEVIKNHSEQTEALLTRFDLNRELGPRADALRDSVSKASHIVREAVTAFDDLATTEFKKLAAEVFFDDIASQYERISAEIETIEITGYPRAHKMAFDAFDRNALIYEIVAEDQTMTFDLTVESVPQDATISYKRKGGGYTKHPKTTDSVIENLVYAIWSVRVQKEGYQEDEKDHDPTRERNHVVRFDLKPK